MKKTILYLLLVLVSFLYGQTQLDWNSQLRNRPNITRVGANSTWTDNVAFTNNLTSGKVNNAIYVDGTQFTTLAAAFAALPGGGGQIHIPPGQPLTLTSAITVSTPATELICDGPFSGININMTGDVFLVQQDEFRIKNCFISITTTSSRLNAAIFAGGSPNTHGARLLLENSVINGNATSTNNGQVLRCTGSSLNGCEEWEVRNTKIVGPGTWQDFEIITNSAASPTADTFTIMNTRQIGVINFTDGAFVYDGDIDTVFIAGGTTFRTNNTGSDIITRNTVGAPAEFPRWVHMDQNSEFEGGSSNGGVTAINFITGKDNRVTGEIATTQVGVAIGANCIECTVEQTIFVGIGQQAITIANGAIKTSISLNRFDSTGVNLNNTYNTIDVAANTVDFRILGNIWRNTGAAAPAHGINIAAGTSNGFVIAGNVAGIAPFGTSFISNGASGGNQNIYGQDLTGSDVFLTGTIGLAGGGPFLTTTAGKLTYGGTNILVASGTSTMNSGSVSTNSCQTTVTSTATGVIATDAIEWAYNAVPGLADALLTVSAIPSTGNVNFVRCNTTNASQTSTAVVINWRVLRGF